MVEVSGNADIIPQDFKGRIEFKDVSFAYPAR